MPTVRTGDIRNIVLTGHGLSGKTTLVERILVHTRAIGKMGSIQDRNTAGDFEPEERAHLHSLSAKLFHVDFQGRHINVIDAPGAGDFLGQAVSVLPAVETVAVLIDATKGIEVTTRRMMKIAGELGLPRLLIVTKIDHAEADLAGLIEEIHAAFGPECIPINLPIKANADVIDVFDHATPEGQPEPAIMTVEAAHQHILEQVVEMDEDLTAEYFDKGDQLDAAKLHRAMELALRAGHLIPICFCSAKTGAGIDDLLHIIAAQCPSPFEASPPPLLMPAASTNGSANGSSNGSAHTSTNGAAHETSHSDAVPFEPDLSSPDRPAVAHVFKVINDPFVGKLSVFRVLQGAVRAKSELFLSGSSKPVRIAHLFRLQGKEHAEVDHVIAGDIGVVPKVDELKYNSILHANPALRLLPPRLPLPQPLYGLAVDLKNHADEARFTTALHRLQEEDPTFRMERVAATGQTVLRGLGELHLRVALEKLKGRYNLDLDTHPMKVAYKETISAKADGHHRHKKQTGGAGQFGEVFLRVEPLPLDHPDGFEFVNDTVGGSIPRQFMPAIEKGCRQVLSTGAIAGYPIRGVRVSVYDGKSHEVDSKEVAFVAAGKKAFIDAMTKARPVLLEPWVLVEITAPASKMGDITALLFGKRGRIESSEVTGADQSTIRAVAPLAELMNFSSELKSLTGGQGSYTMEYSHDDRTPPNVQAAVIAAYKPKADED